MNLDLASGEIMELAPVAGMPDDVLHTLTGYGPDVAKNRAEAQAIMKRLGYGPDNMLKTKIFTRNINTFRDPALTRLYQPVAVILTRLTPRGISISASSIPMSPSSNWQIC